MAINDTAMSTITVEQKGTHISGIARAGDVNGDGLNDFLVETTVESYISNVHEGQTIYLLYGRSNGSRYFQIPTDAAESFTGGNECSGDQWGVCIFSFTGAGDVNNDGFDDLVFGVPGNREGGYVECNPAVNQECINGDAGQTYLIFGRSEGWKQNMSLQDSNASFIGEGPTDRAGQSVAGGGDFNGDGIDDLIIGAYTNPENGHNAGQVYLILGKTSGWQMDTPLSEADASFRGDGKWANAGEKVAFAGDVNKDGFDDILIGSPNYVYGERGPGSENSIGRVDLVLGRDHGLRMDMDLSNSDASFLTKKKEYTNNAEVGMIFCGIGDVNADGYDDIAVATESYYKINGYTRIYIIFGQSKGWERLSKLSDVADVTFTGPMANAFFDGPVDIDGNGFDDLVFAYHEYCYSCLPPEGKYQLYIALFRPGNADRPAQLTIAALIAQPSCGLPILATLMIVVLTGMVIGLTEVGAFGLYSFLFLLYTRIGKLQVLDNFTRGCIYGHVTANPGLQLGELCKALKLSKGTLTYHLKTLEREKLVFSYTNGTKKVFFPSTIKVTSSFLNMTKVQRLIYKVITDKPGISQKGIGKVSGLSAAGVSRNIRIMKVNELIEVKEGRNNKCYVIDY